jgi:hypothetical protein
MSSRRLAFAAAAEALAGAPFRFRGRDATTGLDCVGLVMAALEEIGSPAPEIAPYSIRQRHFTEQLAGAGVAGFGDVGGPIESGDLLLLRPGPGQAHLAVVGRRMGLIHAHARLGRVVITPTPSPFPIERHWRLREN